MSLPGPFRSPEPAHSNTAVLDRAAKRVFAEAPRAALLLAGATLPEGIAIRREDVNINIAEHRADHLFVPDLPHNPWGLHMEYVTQPDPRQHTNWYYKNACFNKQLNMPVPLAVIYLEKGHYATFHTGCTIEAGGIGTSFTWHTEYLWDHVPEIRYGGLKELASLLPLCFDHPTVDILEEQKALIRGLDVDETRRMELTAIAMMVDRRKFGESVLDAIFREELPMLKEMEFVQEWIADSRQEGRQEGMTRGRIIGRIEFLGQLLHHEIPTSSEMDVMPVGDLQTLAMRLERSLGG